MLQKPTPTLTSKSVYTVTDVDIDIGMQSYIIEYTMVYLASLLPIL